MTTVAPPRTGIIVPAADLKAAAAWAARIIPPRPALPILGGLVLDGRDGMLSLSAFDYETYGSIALPVDGAIDEPLVIHGRMFSDAAARLTGAVSLSVDDRDLVLSAGRTAIRVRIIPGADYPEVPPQAPTSATVDAAALADMVHAAAVCAGRDEAKNVELSRLRLVAADGVLTTWATDRYRAAQVSIPWTGDSFDVLIAAAPLAAAVKGMTGPVQLGADEHRLTLAAADRTVTLVLATGNWANVQGLWSPRGDAVHVDRTDLADALATARLATDDKPAVHVDVEDGQITVTAAADRGDAHVDVDGVGDLTVPWVVNVAFLSEIVAVLPGPRVHLAADRRKATTLPIEVRGADADGVPIDGATYLVVPIRAVGAR